MKKISTDTYSCSGLKDCLDCPYSIKDTMVMLYNEDGPLQIKSVFDIPTMEDGCMDIWAWHYHVLTCLHNDRVVKIKRIISSYHILVFKTDAPGKVVNRLSIGPVSIPPWCLLEDDD